MTPSEASEPTRPRGVPQAAVLRVFRVPPECAGMRVDVFLQSQLKNTSRTRARAIVENSAYSPTGRPLRPSERLKAEDRVALWRTPPDDDHPVTEIAVLYEDDDLLVVDKPAGMAVHPTARHHNATVIKRLQAQRPGEFLSLVHRIDRETSGILLVARTREAERGFKRLLEDRSVAQMAQGAEAFARATERERRALHHRARQAQPVDKTYLAITWGVPGVSRVDLPVEPDVDNPLRVKMRIAAPGTGLDALTELEVREQAAGYALVACELRTGRQHQIRVHLAAVGCPVVGDKLYGPDERMLARAADGELTEQDLVRLELPRHALHAHRYCLAHPITGRPLELVSPLPEDMARFWSERKANQVG